MPLRVSESWAEGRTVHVQGWGGGQGGLLGEGKGRQALNLSYPGLLQQKSSRINGVYLGCVCRGTSKWITRAGPGLSGHHRPDP